MRHLYQPPTPLGNTAEAKAERMEDGAGELSNVKCHPLKVTCCQIHELTTAVITCTRLNHLKILRWGGSQAPPLARSYWQLTAFGEESFIFSSGQW